MFLMRKRIMKSIEETHDYTRSIWVINQWHEFLIIMVFFRKKKREQREYKPRNNGQGNQQNL